MRKLILESFGSTRYRVDIDEKLEDGQKIPYLIIQNKVAIDRYAKYTGSQALILYRMLKGKKVREKVVVFDNECRKLIDDQQTAQAKIRVEDEEDFVQVKAPVNDIWVVECQHALTNEQYDRLKAQVDESWPPHLSKPILLEVGLTIKKMNIGV